MDKQNTQIELSESLTKKIRHIANQTGASFSDVIEEMLAQAFEDDGTVTTSEAAKMLCVSPATIRRNWNAWGLHTIGRAAHGERVFTRISVKERIRILND